MKRLFKFPYPKIILFLIITIISYFIFTNPGVISYLDGLEILHTNWGVFIAGILFAFGFTTPLSIGLFLTLNPSSILFASIIGALGSLIADLLIFKLIHMSFMDEFKSLERTKPFKFIEYEFDNNFSAHVRNYLLYIFAGIIFASPLPDEVGVTMLVGLSRINPYIFSIISFLLHAVGIAAILLIAG